VPVKRCTVSFRGVSGICHRVELDAESVYEAAVRGVVLLRKDGWVDSLGRGTELEVQVREPGTTHRVTVQQIQRWCDGVTVSPADTLKRVKLKQMLAASSRTHSAYRCDGWSNDPDERCFTERPITGPFDVSCGSSKSITVTSWAARASKRRLSRHDLPLASVIVEHIETVG
jgi:hypothetical protein